MHAVYNRKHNGPDSCAVCCYAKSLMLDSMSKLEYIYRTANMSQYHAES